KDKGVTLEDNQVLDIIAKESKKRKDSLADYKKSGREDLIMQVEKEIDILATYLPKQLTRDEITVIVKQIIEQTGATSIKDMGMIMKQAKANMGASADGKTIN